MFQLLSLGVSLLGLGMQRSAARKAELAAKRQGEAEAKQYLTDRLLVKAEAMDAGTQRLKDMRLAENQNIAAFNAMGRSDRSVDAFLKANRQTSFEDFSRIERRSELEAARMVTAAAVSKAYGANTAAGIRARANANFLTGLGDIIQNIPYTPKAPAVNTLPSGSAPTTSLRPQIRPPQA